MTDVSPTPAHPFTSPTDLDDIDRPEMRSSWPTAIGVIAIVFGVLGVLYHLFSIVPFALRWFGVNVDDPDPDMKVALSWETWIVLLAGLATALAVVLLVAGIGLVRRRRRAVRTLAGWATFRMLLAVGQAAVNYRLAPAQYAVMRNDPSMAGMPSGFVELIGPITAGVLLIWGCALPIFLLIWFGRRKIKDEVTTWP